MEQFVGLIQLRPEITHRHKLNFHHLRIIHPETVGRVTRMKFHEFRCLSHSHLYRQNLFNYTSLYCASQTWHIFYKLKPGFCAPGSAWKVGMETSPARHGHLVPVPGGPAHQRAHYLNIILCLFIVPCYDLSVPCIFL